MSDAATPSGGGEAAAPATTAEPQAPANDNGQAPQLSTDDSSQVPAEAKHKLRVGGEEKELSLSEVLKLAQKAEGVEVRFREVAAQRKQIESLRQHLTNIEAKLARDPIMAAYMSGDRTKFHEAVYQDLEYEAMPPEQRRRIDEDRRLRERAQRADEYERAEQDRQRTELANRARSQLTERFTAALKTAGVSMTPYAMGRMASLAEGALHAGQRVSAQQLAERVRDEIRAEFGAYAGGLEPERMAEVLGEEQLRKLRAHEVAKLKPQAAPQPVPRQANGQFAPRSEPARRPSTSEYMRQLREGKR